jgi:NitT/TauT family transport system ATP-binding protein
VRATPAALSANGITYSFPDGPVVDRLDLQLRRGEFVSLVGPSGCGKSTVLRLLAGLAYPDSGTVEVDGHSAGPPGPDRVLVLQQESLFPWRTVAGNVDFGLQAQGVPRRERSDRRRAALEAVDLVDASHLYPAQLSGGMRQRCQLARALAVRPKVLLLDEPLGALDWQARWRLQDVLLALAADQTTLLVTHDIDEATYLSHRVVVLSERPAGVRGVVVIDLPRQRSPELRLDPAYLSARQEILQMLGFV